MGGLEQERVLIRFTVKKKKSLLSSSLDNKTVKELRWKEGPQSRVPQMTMAWAKG